MNSDSGSVRNFSRRVPCVQTQGLVPQYGNQEWKGAYYKMVSRGRNENISKCALRLTIQVNTFFSLSSSPSLPESIAHTPSLYCNTTDTGMRWPGVKFVGYEYMRQQLKPRYVDKRVYRCMQRRVLSVLRRNDRSTCKCNDNVHAPATPEPRGYESTENKIKVHAETSASHTIEKRAT